MQKPEHHNDTYSEKYKKYLVRITYNNNNYYTLWGADLTTFNEEDKVLINDRNQLLLFKSIKALLDYIDAENNLFDEQNTITWLNEIKQPISSHSSINIDLLNFKDFELDDNDFFTELVEAKNLISDFAIQTNNKLINDLLISKDAEDFYDAYMDNYVWEGVKTPIDKELVQRVVLLYNNLFNEVSKRIQIKK